MCTSFQFELGQDGAVIGIRDHSDEMLLMPSSGMGMHAKDQSDFLGPKSFWVIQNAFFGKNCS